MADQVHQLVSASEADPERGFMARTMVLPAPWQSPSIQATERPLHALHGPAGVFEQNVALRVAGKMV